MKIFEQILNQHLHDIVKISTNQCGFIKGSNTDAIFTAHSWKNSKKRESYYT